jgi:photosystem II stability/assembly factor-like uncharacterized protein
MKYRLMYCVVLGFTISISGFAQINWEQVNPLPQGLSLNSVVYCSNQFIAVGEVSTILTSPDGVTWTVKSSNTFIKLNCVAHGNNQFVAVGSSGQILTSPDGSTWEITSSGTHVELHSVVFGNNRFVAVGDSGTIITSPDGATWTAKSSGTTVGFCSIAYGNNKFVAVSYSDTIDTSPDGINWTAKSSGINISQISFPFVAYGNNKFVAVSYSRRWVNKAVIPFYNLLTSVDGSTWTVSSFSTSSGISSITNGSNQFVAVGSFGRIFASPDGSTWTTGSFETNNSFSSVAYGNNKFVAVGDFGDIRYSRADSDGTLTRAISKKTISCLKLVYLGDRIYVQLPVAKNTGNFFNIRMFSAAGRSIYSAEKKCDNGSVNLSTNGIPSGVYLVKITNDHGLKFSGSFVKNR